MDSTLALAAVFTTAFAILLLLAQLAGQREPQVSPAPGFLTRTLGAPQASASLVRKPQPGVRVAVGAKGAEFVRGRTAVAVRFEGSSGIWQRHLRGANRPTSFGRETVIFRGEYGVEQFLTVERRQGVRTWRWALTAPGARPVLAADGGVDFWRGGASAGVRIESVAIFDTRRRDVTPDDARWSLLREGTSWALELELDDSKLPLPYVIDPNITRTAFNSAASATNGGVTSLAITRPGNADDILIAHLSVQNNNTINAAAGWTLVDQRIAGAMTQAVFWATNSGSLSTTFTWTNGAHAAGGITAFADVHPTSPIDDFTPNSGNGTTATALGLVPNFNDAMVLALYGARGNVTLSQSGGQTVTQTYAAASTANPAGGRSRATAADGQLVSPPSTSGDKTASVSATADWAAHLVALRREPPDGLGSIAPDRTNVAASSTGNTLVLTYTAPADGVAGGEVRVTVPSGWSAPSTTGTDAGFTEASAGTVSVSGQTIIVGNLTVAESGTFTITYGSTSGGGPGTTAPSTTGAQTWNAEQKGTSGGTLTALASSPSITVNAAEGSGTLTTPTTNVVASSTGNTITFTYTAAAGGMSDGSVSIDVPSGWSAPSTTGTAAGYTTSTAGTVGVSGQTITVSGLTLAGAATVDVVYGSTAGGGPGATATSSVGAQTWQGKQRSTNVGALVNLASSPSITVDSQDGTGTAAADPTSVGYATPGNTITLTYTSANAMSDGAISVDVPAGWSAPSTTGTAAGYTTATAGTVGVSGQTITVSGLTIGSGATVDVVYGSTAGGGPSATAPASAGAQTWLVKQRSTAGGTLTDLSSSPSVTVEPQPAAPSGLATTPASPANDTSPSVSGTAPAGSTVRIYTTADCTGGVAASGTAAEFASPGLSVTVPDNATTSLSATATDSYGAISACSASIDYTADSTAPQTTIDSAPASPTSSTDADFAFSSSEGGSSFDCRIDGGSWEACSSPKSYTGVSEGAHTFDVRATDAAGNTDPTPASHGWTIDTTAPQTTIDSAPASPTSSTDADFAFSSSEGGSTFECRIDGGSWEACTSPKSYTALAEGAHTFDVRATDPAGNTDPTPASYSWTIDTTAPQTTIDSAPADPTSSTDADFAFSSSEGASTFECRLDGGTWEACTSPKSYTALAEGAHSFDVRATDAAGNTDATPAGHGWTIDTTAPQTTIDSAPPALSNSADADFAFSSSEGGSSFECRLDAGAWEACTSPKSYTGLAEGAHAFDVRATDAAGNTDPTPASYSWTIDVTAPETAIDSSPSTPSNLSDAEFEFSSDDPTASFECRLNAGAWAVCTSPESYAALADGLHVFDVRARDDAGNVDATPSSFAWTIDIVAPDTTIDSAPGALSNSADADFEFSSSEGGSTFECRLDGGAWEACTSPKSYTTLGDGAHTFDVRATDAAGNTDPTPAGHSWTIDTTAPNTTIDSAPPALTNSDDADFQFSASEGGSTFECRIDGGAWEACTSPKSYTGLGDGAHTFDVRATDPAGNTDATPASHSWTIDTTAPQTTIDSAPADPTSSTDADFAFSASEGGSTFECRLDGGAWEACTSPKSYTGLGEGAHSFDVRATDPAGNTDATPASHSWTIDTTAPQTTIDSAPADPSNTADPSFGFSSSEGGSTFECRLDGAAWEACTSPKSYTGLAEGAHTFDVRATDPAGNTDATPASHSWTIDTTAPTTTVSFPAEGGSYNASTWADPSGTAADAVALDRVELSMRIAGGNWWNGTDFSATSEFWHTANGTATWSLDFPASSFPVDGDYVLRARSIDTAGNVEAPQSRSFTVDTVAPTTTIDSAPPDPVSSTDASFEFSADQAGSTFECRLDGAAWEACTSPKSYTGLAQGSHTFDVRATDPAGNVGAAASHTWVVDTVPPVVTMDDPGAYLRGIVALGGSASDPGGSGIASTTFEHSPAGTGTWSTMTSPWDTLPVANGQYDLRFTATDNAGNTASSTPITNVWVDNEKPTVTIDDPGAAVSGTVTLSANAADAHSGIDSVAFEYKRSSDSTWTPTAASWDTTTLPDGDGSYDLRAIANDRAGNQELSASATTIVDNVAPTVDFSSPLDGAYLNASAADPYTLVANAADDGSGVADVEFWVCDDDSTDCSDGGWVSLGTDATAPYEASWPLPAGDGDRALRARATDGAGHSATAVVNVTLDRVEPETTLLTNPGDPSNLATPTFTFDSSESGSSFECRLDGGAWSACASPHTTAALSDATHTFEVRATDTAGNVDPTPAAWTWLVDTTPPTATMDDPGANLRGLVSLTSSQSDPGPNASGLASVQLEYSVADADSWAPVASSWDTTLVADGLYDLRVVVADNAGNVTNSALVEDRRVDNAPPATAIDDPGANLRATITLSGSASDGGSGVQEVVFQVSPDGFSWSAVGTANVSPYAVLFDTTSLADGLYQFRTVATDIAGNVTEGVPVVDRRIDNTPPLATMHDPGDNLRATVTLSSDSSDPGGSGVSTVEYQALIGGTWTGISGTWDTTSVPDGLYDLRVVVGDVAGNVTESAPVTSRRVDNTPPVTTDDAPSGWQPGDVTVTLSPSDAGSGVSNTTYALDGGAPQSGTSVLVSGDGIHSISYFSTDVAGNIESPNTASVMIDSTPPDPGANDPGNYLRGDVTLSANPDAGEEGAQVTEVEFQHSPAGAGSWASLGIVPAPGPYEVVWSTTAADDGSWDLRFIVRDEAGNESIVDMSSKIVDNTPPTGAVSSPLAGSTVSGTVTLGVTASDDNPIVSVEYFVRGSSVGTSTTAPFQLNWDSTSGGDGSATIFAVISDIAGNSTTTSDVTVTVDNFAPTVTLADPGSYLRGTVTLSASADGDTVQVTFERRPAGGGGWTTIDVDTSAPWSADFDTTAAADGLWELRAIAVDAGANSGTSNVATARVDNTAPSGSLTEPSDGLTVGGIVALVATASDGGSGVAQVIWQARPSSGSFADVASDSSAPFAASWDVSGVASGAYDLRIVVTDAAGNTYTGGTISLTVDADPPTVTLADPGSPVSGTVGLSAVASADTASVSFFFSPGGAATWTPISTDSSAPFGASWNTTSVPEGLYDVRARAVDAVGNAAESVVAGIRVDNHAPSIVSSVPANGAIVASASQIEITASEEIGALEDVELDGSPAPAPTMSPDGKTATYNTGALADGTHTLTGTVRDLAGKSSTFSISFFVGVPAPPPPPPPVPFTATPAAVPAPTGFRGVIEENGTLTLRWTPARDASGAELATILFVDDLAVRTLDPGVDELNLGPFDPADLRTFALAATTSAGQLSGLTDRLRSTSHLVGRTLEEATATLVQRGFEVGEVHGAGPVVVAPADPVLAALGSAVDLELGELGGAQARYIFNVVGTKKVLLTSRRFVALRTQTTRNSQVTATLVNTRGQRLHRWRFALKPGAKIVRLNLPAKTRKAGKYRVSLAVQSGDERLTRAIAVRFLAKRPKVIRPPKRVEVVLADPRGTEIRDDVADGVNDPRVRVVAAFDDDTWTLTGSAGHNVQVVVVDVDRYGVGLVRNLRIVFPSVRLIALSNDPRLLAQSMRAGAAIAVPRSTSPTALARLIRQLAFRQPY